MTTMNKVQGEQGGTILLRLLPDDDHINEKKLLCSKDFCVISIT